MKDLGSFSNTFKQTIGRVPGDALPYFSLTVDGGDWYTLPTPPNNYDAVIGFDLLIHSEVADHSNQFFLSMNDNGSSGIIIYVQKEGVASKIEIDCYSAEGDLDYISPTISVDTYYSVSILRVLDHYTYFIDGVNVLEGDLAGLDYSTLIRAALFSNSNIGSLSSPLSGAKIKNMVGLFGWPSLISTKKAYADVAKTTPITNGSACAVIETSAGDIVQSSVGAMATANIPPV